MQGEENSLRLLFPACGDSYLVPPLFIKTAHQCPESLMQAIIRPKTTLLMIIKSGVAGLCLYKEHECQNRKRLRRYMVRQSQGKSQLKHLHEKGKSRLGSRIRLQQTRKFFEDLNHWLAENKPQDDDYQIFISCPTRLWGYWWKEHPPLGLVKSAPQWRPIPLHCHDPTAQELARVYQLLSKFQQISHSMD